MEAKEAAEETCSGTVTGKTGKETSSTSNAGTTSREQTPSSETPLGKMYDGWWMEYWNCETMYHDDGFMAYEITPEGDLFVLHFYINPPARGLKECGKMYDMIKAIGKRYACKRLTCGVNVSLKRATERLALFIRYGFRVEKLIQSYVYLEYELKYD